MAQPLLTLQHRNGSHQVYRLTGASSQAFGDPLPTGSIEDASGVTNNAVKSFNRVIQFQGGVYAAARNGVYIKTDPTLDTGAWTQNHVFTNPAPANRSFHIHGPYQIVLGDVPSLFVIWSTSTSTTTWNAAILNGNTGVWSEIGEQTAVTASSTTAYGDQIVYRGVLYVMYEGGILTFDPGASSFGVISLAAGLTTAVRAGFGIFNDRLLIIGTNTSASTFIALFEIVGGAVAHLFDTTLSQRPVAETGAKKTLVPSPDGSVLYAFCATDSGGDGLALLKIIDSAGTLSESTDLTNPVIPVGLRPGSGTATVRTWAFYDQETVPGTARLLLYVAPDGVTSSLVTQYVFVNESTVMTQEDQGGNAAWSFASTMTGGGERIFTPGELHIEIVNRLAVFGGEEVRFKVYGDSGPADKNVEFRFNTQNEVPLTVATLIGTPSVVSGGAVAPSRVGNELQGVEADGTSVYETVWDIGTDGVSAGQRAQLVPRVSI